MSFGFGVGDFLATLRLFKTVAEGIKNYRNAPADFQQLQVELELLQNTLLQVLRTEPVHDGERELIDRIRAIAMHCHGPLQVFLDKMRHKAGTLGHFHKTRTLSDVGIRLYWSIITQKDVEDLRKLILSEMVAITVLLSMRQITELKRLGVESNQVQLQSLEVFRETQLIRTQNDALLQIVSSTPSAINDVRDLVSTSMQQQAQHEAIVTQDMGNLVDQMKSLALFSNRTLEIVRAGGAQVNQAIGRMSHLLRDIQQLIQILARCSGEMLKAIAQNTYLFLNISRQMKKIIRTIEAIPLHLTLDIIRLDDALGESWGLPFQACTTWDSFKDLLLSVVFGNGRVGASRVLYDKFVITSAKTGRPLSPSTWEKMVKVGIHLHQAIVIDEKSHLTETCPYPFCNGVLEVESKPSNERVCSRCGKWSMTLAKTEPLLKETEAVIEESTEAGASTSLPSPPLNPRPLSSIQVPDEDIKLYRRVQFYEPSPEINSVDEAREILATDEFNAPANRYLGWWNLRYNDPSLVVGALEKAAMSNPFDSQTWYLLARAHLALSGMAWNPKLELSYTCTQSAISGNWRCPDCWLTAGIIFYIPNQYRGCLDCLSRAVRLNPYFPLSWYHLGILYNAVGQDADTHDALGRALELDPTFLEASDLLERLQTRHGHGTTKLASPSGLKLEMIQTSLLHVSEIIPLYGYEQDIEIPPLHLASDNDKVDEYDNEYDEEEDAWEGEEHVWEDKR